MQPFRRQTSAPVLALGPQARAAEGNGYSPAATNCATLLLEIMPRVLKAVRVAVKNRPASDLTVPQFRTLIFVHQHAGASLSEAAEFLGLSLPSASKLVDGLVKRSILVRQSATEDRRRMTLRLTRKGDALLSGAQDTVRRHLAGLLSQLNEPTLGSLAEALAVLQDSFPPLGGEVSPPQTHRFPKVRQMPQQASQRAI